MNKQQQQKQQDVDAGSRMHMLDWVESPNFIVTLQHLLEGTGFTIGSDATWQPKSRHDYCESALVGKDDFFVAPKIKEDLKKWWLAHAVGAKLPTWDLVVSARDEHGVSGLVLVEAKAHLTELSNEGKKLSKRDSQEAQARTDANHVKIGEAIEGASAALQSVVPGIGLTRDRSYQLCNRIAFSWKLASEGIPVVLIYLGFFGDKQISSGKDDFLASANDWRRVFLQHIKPHFPASHVERPIDCGPATFQLLVSALPVARQSPAINDRRKL